MIFSFLNSRHFDDILRWRHFFHHDGFLNFLRIMSNLARYSAWNICHVIKTGKYLTFQNLTTELKYHDQSSTICILKRTRFYMLKMSKIRCFWWRHQKNSDANKKKKKQNISSNGGIRPLPPFQKSSKKPILNRVKK